MIVTVKKVIDHNTYKVCWNSITRDKKYGKYCKNLHTRIVHFQGGGGDIKEGDKVLIFQSKPFSKTKSWEIKI